MHRPFILTHTEENALAPTRLNHTLPLIVKPTAACTIGFAIRA
jgi:hypothetical protein